MAQAEPKIIQFPPEKNFNKSIDIKSGEEQRVLVKAISSCSSHCLALTSNGSVYSWGNGEGGRLGHGDKTGKDAPMQIMALAHLKVEQIACGDSHSACIANNKQLYMWGVGLNGRLGMATDQNQMVP